MIRSYRDLEVYQNSYRLALEVHRLTLKYPQIENYELGRQLRTASKSIPLNIGEGYGRKHSAADFRRFLVMALGSCDEVRIQMDFSKDLGYITEEQHQYFTERYNVVGKQLNKLVQKWQEY